MSIIKITIEKSIRGIDEPIRDEACYDTNLVGLNNDKEKMIFFLKVARDLKMEVDMKGEEAKGIERAASKNRAGGLTLKEHDE